MKMEYVTNQSQIHDSFNGNQEISLKDLNLPANKEKDTAYKSSNKRRGARRRRNSTDSDNYTVSLSRVQIYESNRVLRSKSKGDPITSLESAEIPQNSAQTKAISNDHSYSRNSKRSTTKKEHITFSTTFHFNDFLDLTSSEENSDGFKEETFEDADSIPDQEFKIEAIDFDDLESLNFSVEDRSCVCDQHSSNQSFESRNINTPVDQESAPNDSHSHSIEIKASSDESTSEEGSEKETACENQKKDESAADTDRLVAHKTAYLSADALLLEEAFKMLDSAENLDLLIPKETASNGDFLQGPTYFDLDEFPKKAPSQNNSFLTNPQADQDDDGASPLNISSGGIFEWLGIPAPSTSKKLPQPDSCTSNDYRWSDVQIKFKGQKTMHEICEYLRPFEKSFITNFPINWTDPLCPSFEPIFGKQSESVTRSKPDLISGFHNSAYFPKINLTSTSGGCIERVMSPVIPRQPQIQKKYPGITIPSKIRDIPNLTPETSQLDNLMGQQPECRIFLVDTPPPFTRTEQQTETQIIPQSMDAGVDIIKSHQSVRKSHQRSSNKISTTYKPKRTRRTRAQMETHRQQRACNYIREKSHRSDRHISRKDHRRMHSHEGNIKLTELSPRFPDFLSLPSCQYQSRHESHSVNESALFGVANFSPERSKSLDNNHPNGLRYTPELKNNKSLWSLDNEGRDWNSLGNCQDYYEPSTVSYEENRSLHQHSAFGNVGQDLVGNSDPTCSGMQTFAPELPYTNLTTTPFSFNPADANQLYNF